MKKIFITIAVASISSLITVFAFRYFDRKQNHIDTYFRNQIPVSSVNMSGDLPVTGPDFVNAAEKTIHSVVHIRTLYAYKNSYYDLFFGYDPFFNFFNSDPYRSQPLTGMGSGVIVSENGYIVTNNHVVSDAQKIEVTLNDKRTYEATLIGSDAGTDLALIKIEEKNLPYITYGNSDETKIGEWVLAVGNPFNLTSTVTAGIVSAKARDINILGHNGSVESFIQTDAAVNPGNSGGALVNTEGELIGINAAIATNTGSYAGYSFAIPSNIVRKVIADLIEFGEIQRAFLGIDFTDIDSKLAKSKELNDMNGVYVTGIVEGGASAKAGLKPGDIIVKFNNTTIHSQSELKEMLIRQRPGDKVLLSVLRDKSYKTFEVILENSQGSTGTMITENGEIVKMLGATFENIGVKDKQMLNIDYGVKVINLEKGVIASSGINTGFIVLSVNNKTVKDTKDLSKYLSETKGKVIIEGIYSNGMHAYYAFNI